MTELANIISPAPAFTIFTVAFAGIIGFIAGYLLRAAIIAKHKSRVLTLEDEMLANHSRILDLEKQVTDLKNEKIKIPGTQPGISNVGLKAS